MSVLLQINMEPDLIAFKRITFSEAVVFAKTAPIPAQPDPLMERLVAAVDAAQQSGALQSGDTAELAQHLIHCLVSLPTSVAMMGGQEFNEPAAIATHFVRTWDWLVAGVERRVR